MKAIAVVVLAPLDLLDVVRVRRLHMLIAGPERQGRQAVVGPDFVYDIVVHRTGVRLFINHSQFGQQLEYALGFHLQLSSQLVNSNLHTSARFALVIPHFDHTRTAIRP
jgi:hypothetical protein